MTGTARQPLLRTAAAAGLWALALAAPAAADKVTEVLDGAVAACRAGNAKVIEELARLGWAEQDPSALPLAAARNFVVPSELERLRANGINPAGHADSLARLEAKALGLSHLKNLPDDNAVYAYLTTPAHSVLHLSRLKQGDAWATTCKLVLTAADLPAPMAHTGDTPISDEERDGLSVTLIDAPRIAELGQGPFEASLFLVLRASQPVGN